MWHIVSTFQDDLDTNFSEVLKHAHGQYSTDTVDRAGKIAGELSRTLDEAFRNNITETNKKEDSYRKKHNYQDDIEAFVLEYKADRLFDIIPGREHQAFPGFKCNPTIKNPSKFKSRLLKYSHKLDSSRDVLD